MAVKKICVVTGTRAEYGLLKPVIGKIEASSRLSLQLVATGMHLSPEFGLTHREIEKDGFSLDRQVEMLLSSDTPTGIAKSIGLGVIGFADVFRELRPDLLLVLGDRFEILSAVVAAMAGRLPVAHIHGGELTEGLIDDPIRHSITKMSHLHFVAAEEYRLRVIQLGEEPSRVFQVGGLGSELVKNRMNAPSRAELEAELDFVFQERNLLITFHPVTLEKNTAAGQMMELLDALAEQENMGLIFTMPNADTGGRILFDLVNEFTSQQPNAKAYTSLGQRNYFGCVAQVDGVVGNSSSGLLEVPALKRGTINVGDRQRGRLQASSVIDVEPTKASILAGISTLYSEDFQAGLDSIENPYGDGNTSQRIVAALENHTLDGLVKKVFFNLPVGQ